MFCRARLPLPVGHGYAISPVALYPASRGTLRLASGDVRDAPLIDPQLLAHEDAWDIVSFANERQAPTGFAQPVRAW